MLPWESCVIPVQKRAEMVFVLAGSILSTGKEFQFGDGSVVQLVDSFQKKAHTK